MPAWVTRAREWIEYLAFRIVAAAFSAMPLDFATALSGWIWGVVARRLPRHQRALENLALAFPDMSPQERERIAREMWRHLGRTFAEFFHLPRILSGPRVDFVTSAAFEKVAASAPFVVCVPHLGNWEIAAQAGVRFGFPLAGTYQALTNPLVDKWVHERRKPIYAGGLFSKSSTTARTLLKLSKSGICPAFVADLRDMRGVPTIFFGQTAWSTPFPALIAYANGLPLYAACVTRLPGGRFEVRIIEVAIPRTGNRDADVQAATQGVQSAFEAFVREWPEQWMWAHKRWV